MWWAEWSKTKTGEKNSKYQISSNSYKAVKYKLWHEGCESEGEDGEIKTKVKKNQVKISERDNQRESV